MSMSLFIAQAIEEKLKAEGVVIEPPSREDEPMLPFEGGGE